MILKTKFIEIVDNLRSELCKYVDCDSVKEAETRQKLRDLQATLVRGHNFIPAKKNNEELYLLNMNYDGFLAELIVENWLRFYKVNYSYDGEDFYQNYVIQYGDPFINSKNTCDLIINNKRIDIKKTSWDYNFKSIRVTKSYQRGELADPNTNPYIKNCVNYYCHHTEEIKRKNLDYYFLVDGMNALIVIDINAKEVVYVDANITRVDKYWFVWKK